MISYTQRQCEPRRHVIANPNTHTNNIITKIHTTTTIASDTKYNNSHQQLAVTLKSEFLDASQYQHSITAVINGHEISYMPASMLNSHTTDTKHKLFHITIYAGLTPFDSIKLTSQKLIHSVHYPSTYKDKRTQLHATSKNTHPVEQYISNSIIFHFRCTVSEHVSWISDTELRVRVMIPLIVTT